MRISIDPKDPGYPAYQRDRHDGIMPVVFLDGERMEGVVTADDGTGEVVVLVYDEIGSGPRLHRRLVADPDDRGRPLLETRRGRVRIVRRHPAPEAWSERSLVP